MRSAKLKQKADIAETKAKSKSAAGFLCVFVRGELVCAQRRRDCEVGKTGKTFRWKKNIRFFLVFSSIEFQSVIEGESCYLDGINPICIVLLICKKVENLEGNVRPRIWEISHGIGLLSRYICGVSRIH